MGEIPAIHVMVPRCPALDRRDNFHSTDSRVASEVPRGPSRHPAKRLRYLYHACRTIAPPLAPAGRAGRLTPAIIPRWIILPMTAPVWTGSHVLRRCAAWGRGKGVMRGSAVHGLAA